MSISIVSADDVQVHCAPTTEALVADLGDDYDDVPGPALVLVQIDEEGVVITGSHADLVLLAGRIARALDLPVETILEAAGVRAAVTELTAIIARDADFPSGHMMIDPDDITRVLCILTGEAVEQDDEEGDDGERTCDGCDETFNLADGGEAFNLEVGGPLCPDCDGTP